MKRTATTTAVAVVAVTSAAVGTIVSRRRHASAPSGRDRWHSVTINRSPEEVGSLPDPLGDLGKAIEVRVRPAPGGRGTELAARLTDQVPTGLGSVAARLSDEDPVLDLRRALREARSLAEVGEVLMPDAPPTTEQTVASAPLQYATTHGREEGRL